MRTSTVKKVGGGDGAPMGLEEGPPRQRLSPERGRLDAVCAEDALDGGGSEFEAEDLERALGDTDFDADRLAGMDIAARFGLERADHHLAGPAGLGSLGACFEHPHAPKPFIQPAIGKGGGRGHAKRWGL